MVIRGQITQQKLENIYNTVRSTIKNKDCYYTQEEVDKLKSDSQNIFFKGGGNIGRRWEYNRRNRKLVYDTRYK